MENILRLTPVCIIALCGFGSASADEPLPPDILSIEVVSADGGEAILEVGLKSSADGDVELSLPEGATSVADGRAGQDTMRLRKNAGARSERYRYDISHGQYRQLSFRAMVRNASGEVVTEVTKIVELNRDRKPQTPPGLERVPVTMESADGKTVVEYMSRSEARRRGLTPVPPKAEKQAVAPGEETEDRVEE